MTADFGKQLYALAHGVPVEHVEEADVGLSAVRAALAAAPAEDYPDAEGLAVLAENEGRLVSPDDAHTETVTEWRAFGSPPADAWDLTGQGYVGESQVAAQTSALVLRRCGYADVRVESRTVTTSRRESEWKATDQ